MRRLSLLTRSWMVPLVLLAALGPTPRATAQEGQEAAAQQAAKVRRLRELQAEAQKIEAELNRGEPRRPEGPPANVVPPANRPPVGAPANPEAIRKMMEEQAARMREQARQQPGGGDPQAFQARMMEEMRRGMIPPGGPAGAADPQAMMAQQMAAMLRMSEAGGMPIGGPEITDPREMGQRMVLAGLETQLRGLADRIRGTQDAAAREEGTKEFKELISQLVEVRKKRRAKQIEELEKRLAALKDEKIESADDVAKRLLADPQPESAPAAAPSGGAPQAEGNPQKK